MSFIGLNLITVPVYRATTGTFTKGRYSEPIRIAFELTGNIQPDQGKKEQIDRKPGNMATDTEGYIKIFSDVKLLTVKTSEVKKADVVLYDGDLYEVQETGKWPNHYKSRASLYKGELNIGP